MTYVDTFGVEVGIVTGVRRTTFFDDSNFES